MEQGSDAWLQYRKKGLGASDAPAIMGVSPWMTALELYKQKTGESEGFKGNWATRRGNEMEPKARADYELRTGNTCPAALAVHRDYEFLRASLDGYNERLGIVLEIKCPGAEAHDLAVQGLIPEYYYPQIQHQLMVTGAKVCHYYSFRDDRGVLVEVLPNQEYIQDLLRKEIYFWLENVCKGLPPTQD